MNQHDSVQTICRHVRTEQDIPFQNDHIFIRHNGDQIFDIHVYNYANGNENLVSQKDITYTMTIRFEGGTQEAITVTYGRGSVDDDRPELNLYGFQYDADRPCPTAAYLFHHHTGGRSGQSENYGDSSSE